MDWLGKVNNDDTRGVEDERVNVLQNEIDVHKTKMREHLNLADQASEKLRRAEERIAGLEAYQEQASREGLGLRKQIQAALRDVRTLTDEKASLVQQLQSHQLEMNAVSVQHTALKDILQERGVNPSEVRKARAADSPNSQTRMNATPDASRVKELEHQLDLATKGHEELRAQLDEVHEREDSTRRDYEEKLTALDSDHQAAAKYLRGTEKMLSKMKQELQRVKTESADYKKQLDEIRSKDGAAGAKSMGDQAAWEQERTTMEHKFEAAQTALKETIVPLEAKIKELESDIRARDADLGSLRQSHDTTRSDLTTLQSTHQASRADIERLTKENTQLETRARDAEQKVQLLLDQVETSVDSYRRQVSLPDISEDGRTQTHQRGPSTVSSNGGGSGGPFANFVGSQYKHDRQGSAGEGSSYMPSAAPSESDLGASPRMANGTVAINGAGEDNDRNSMALDTLANELDALRSHWQTTNKNYRLSDKFDFDHGDTSDRAGDRSQEDSMMSMDEIVSPNVPSGLNLQNAHHGPSSGSRIASDSSKEATMAKETTGAPGRPAEAKFGQPGALADWRRGLESETSRDSSPMGQRSALTSSAVSPIIGGQ